MESKRAKWIKYLCQIEMMYQGRLREPLSECVYVFHGKLFFHPFKPLDAEVKQMLIQTHFLIFN